MNLYRIDLVRKIKRNPDRDTGEMFVHEFPVLRETPKGFWISGEGYGFGTKWVSKTKKAFAHVSVELAENHFYFRKRKHLEILKKQVQMVSRALGDFVRNKKDNSNWSKTFEGDHKIKWLIPSEFPSVPAND